MLVIGFKIESMSYLRRSNVNNVSNASVCSRINLML